MWVLFCTFALRKNNIIPKSRKGTPKMKTYGIDYTKISEAESSLYSATRLMANDCHDAALERIEEARKLLQEFLNQDNLVKDDDLADGLIKQSETFDDDQLDFIRDIFGNLITDSKNGYLKDKAKGVAHPLQEEELAIINVCQKQLGADEFESVEQFYRNKSNTWNEIIEEEEENED